MISGRDVIISTKSSAAEAMRVAIAAAQKMWSGAVVEDAETGKRLSKSAIAIDPPHEVLVYKDKESAKRWRDLGADSSLNGTMVHFITSSGALTVVIDDDAPPQIQKFAKSLQRDLRQINRRVTI